MHEVGIVNGILDTVIRAARGAGASRAVLVTLRIGDMTEVVREALDFAWETFRDEDPLTRSCELAVEEVHPQSECLDCGEVFEHDRFHCRCPQCGGANVRLLHGRELEERRARALLEVVAGGFHAVFGVLEARVRGARVDVEQVGARGQQIVRGPHA